MADLSTNLNLQLPGFGELAGTWGTGALNTNFTTLDALFGSGGHDHSGGAGSGPKIDHSNLLSIGTLTHAQLEAAISELQNRVDNDNRVGQVRRLDASGAEQVRVDDVTSIDFVNCDVEQTAAGFVKITPIIPQNSAYEITAPVNHFDAFVGPAGTDISLQGWQRITPSDAGTINIQTTGNGIEVRPEYTWNQGSAAGNAVGRSEIAYNLAGVVPHSEVQRLGAVIEAGDFEGVAGSGNSPQILVELGLLQGFFAGGGNLSGVFLQIRKTATAVSCNWLVRNGSTVATKTIVPPAGLPVTSAWGPLTEDYFLGQHEVSLSKDSVSGLYAIHYYYNKALIHKGMEAVGGDVFFDEIRALIAALEASPSNPDFGHFSVTADITDVVSYTGSDPSEAQARPLDLRIDSIMAAATGDRINPKFLASGYQGEVGAPPAPGQTVCSTFDPNPYGNLQVGDPFVPVNGGGTLIVTFAGPDYFIATDVNGVPYTFYCDAAGGEGETSESTSGSGGTTDPNSGNNIQVGESGQFASVSFSANAGTPVPTDYPNGNLTGTNLSDPLPGAFVTGTAANALTSEQEFGYAGIAPISYQLGNRLPIGTKLDAVIDVTYDANNELTSTFTEAIEVGVPAPTELTVKKFVYKGSWQELTASNKARRGDPVAFSVTGRNLPLGGFWASGVGFGRDYRIDNNEYVALNSSTDMFEGGAEYLSAFQAGGPLMSVDGTPISSAVTQVGPGTLPPSELPALTVGALDPNAYETVVVLGRLSKCATTPQTAILEFSNGQTQTATASLFDSVSDGALLASVMDTNSTSIVESTTASVTIRVYNPAPTNRSVSVSSGSVANIVYTDTDPGAGQMWYVDITFDLTAGTFPGDITVTYSDACNASVTGVITVTESGAGTPSDPPAPGATLDETIVYQCEARFLTLTVPAANIVEGDTLSIAGTDATLNDGPLPYAYQASDVGSDYVLTFPIAGTAGGSPSLTVTHTRPGAASPASTVINLTLETPGDLTITGEASYDLPDSEPGETPSLTVDVTMTANASTPWAIPGWDTATVSDTSTLGEASLSTTSPPQDLGNDVYRYTINLANDWEEGDTVTLTVPNHGRFGCAAGQGQTTDYSFSISIPTAISSTRTGQTLNGNPLNLVIEPIGAQDQGKTVDVLNLNGDVVQSFGTISAADTPAGTTQAIKEGTWDIAVSEYANFTDPINLNVRVGTDIFPLQKTVSGSLVNLNHRFPPLPPALNIELLASGEPASSAISVSDNSTITVVITGAAGESIDPSEFSIAGQVTGNPLTPNYVLNGTWSDGGELDSLTVTESATGNHRTRQFELTLGTVTGEGATIALTLTHSVYGTLTQTYAGLINVAPSGSGDPGVGGLGAGS